jgi:hypothetical protein
VNRRLRNPASHGRADANQKAIVAAIEALGHPVLDLHGVGRGCDDLLVPITVRADRALIYTPRGPVVRLWMPVECKVPPIRYTLHQQGWRKATAGWPRLTVTSGQDAVDQLRELAG